MCNLLMGIDCLCKNISVMIRDLIFFTKILGFIGPQPFTVFIYLKFNFCINQHPLHPPSKTNSTKKTLSHLSCCVGCCYLLAYTVFAHFKVNFQRATHSQDKDRKKTFQVPVFLSLYTNKNDSVAFVHNSFFNWTSCQEKILRIKICSKFSVVPFLH